MVTTPAPVIVSVLPDKVAGPCTTAKLTANPEVAVAVKVVVRPET